MYGNILVATDGSETGSKAVAQAASLATSLDARLTIVTVTAEAPTFDRSEIGWSVPDTALDQIRRASAEKGRLVLAAAQAAIDVPARLEHIVNERPYAGILDCAQRVGADLIVVGSHGLTGIERVLLGSQASKVVTLAKVPVLVVKP